VRSYDGLFLIVYVVQVHARDFQPTETARHNYNIYDELHASIHAIPCEIRDTQRSWMMPFANRYPTLRMGPEECIDHKFLLLITNEGII
jgi:hypothetical protein